MAWRTRASLNARARARRKREERRRVHEDRYAGKRQERAGEQESEDGDE